MTIISGAEILLGDFSVYFTQLGLQGVIRVSHFYIYLFIIYSPFVCICIRPLWAYSAGNNHHLCFHWTPVNKTQFKVKFIFILSV